MIEEDFPGIIKPKQRPRFVRCSVYRYKDPETGQEIRDCSTKHATITVHYRRKRWSWRPYQIMFTIGQADGDFLIEEVIREHEQWIWKPKYKCLVFSPFKDDDTPVHEWWAARKHAIRAIAHTRKRAEEKRVKEKLRQAKQKARTLRRYGGVQLSLLSMEDKDGDS